MLVSRHSVDYWIKNKSVDTSIKDINGDVTIHWHEFYEIELILDGAGVYNLDGIDYEIRPGALFVMSPSSIHHIHFSENTRLINFMFTLESCDPAFLCGFFDHNPHFMLQLTPQDMLFFECLAQEMAGSGSLEHLHVMINCILCKIQSMQFPDLKAVKYDKMQLSILYIQNHFKEELTLTDVARIAGYSTNYFGNQFKKYTGQTFKTYIIDLRLSLVKKLLEYSSFSVTEICHQCGFKDFSNFMSCFKKRYSMTPNEYRKRHIGQRISF